MTKISRFVLTVLATALYGAVSVNAAPVQWSSDGNIVLNTGAVVSGSFVFDQDTGVFSNVMINLSGTTDALSQDGLYDTTISASPRTNFAGLLAHIGATSANMTGEAALFLSFDSPLTNAGGTVELHEISSVVCADSICDSLNHTPDQAVAFFDPIGSFSASPTVPSQVPLPATLPLLLVGVGGVFTLSRRKDRQKNA